MTPEVRYLQELLRAFAAGESTPVPPPAGMHWPTFRSLLLGHRIATTLAPLIPADAAPAEFTEELEATVRNLRLRGAFFLLELFRFLPPLESAGCTPVALKGIALSQTVYPNPGMRFFSDLDVLVRRDRIEEACAAMHRFGYAPPAVFRSRAFYERYHFHRILKSPSGIVVEMHWQLSRPSDYFEIELDGLRERCRVVSGGGGGGEMRVPSDSDQLLHAAIQSLQEGFSDIRRALDAALLLRAGAADDARLADRAQDAHLSTALWLLLSVTRQVTGVAAPPRLEESLRPGSLVQFCLASLHVPEQALEKTHPPGLKNLVRWLCSPGAGPALRDMGRFVFPPESLLASEDHQAPVRLSAMNRGMLAVRRSVSLARILGYQSWCLASHRRRRSAAGA